MSEDVRATLYIAVNVDCPSCDMGIDLMDADDTSGRDHNEEGYVIRQACPNDTWTDEHEKFNVEEVKCTLCGHEFNVKGLDW